MPASNIQHRPKLIFFSQALLMVSQRLAELEAGTSGEWQRRVANLSTTSVTETDDVEVRLASIQGRQARCGNDENFISYISDNAKKIVHEAIRGSNPVYGRLPVYIQTKQGAIFEICPSAFDELLIDALIEAEEDFQVTARIVLRGSEPNIRTDSANRCEAERSGQVVFALREVEAMLNYALPLPVISKPAAVVNTEGFENIILAALPEKAVPNSTKRSDEVELFSDSKKNKGGAPRTHDLLAYYGARLLWGVAESQPKDFSKYPVHKQFSEFRRAATSLYGNIIDDKTARGILRPLWNAYCELARRNDRRSES
ncbi:hypothetical protein J2X36_002735 [Methylobacterium sp. BE186]|nr:hypothetical protein [Methylobacterium sp. BE186]